MVKIHTETSILLDKRSWEEKNNYVPTTAAISMVREKKQPWRENLNLGKILIELQKTIEDFKTPKQKKVDWNSPILTNRRPANGKRECYFCKKIAHIAQFCYDNPQSPNFKLNQWNGTTRFQQGNPNKGLQVNNLQENVYYKEAPHQQPQSAFQDDLHLNNLAFQNQELNVNIPCLTLKTSKLITETVQCGEMVVKAVVDTRQDLP